VINREGGRDRKEEGETKLAGKRDRRESVKKVNGWWKTERMEGRGKKEKRTKLGKRQTEEETKEEEGTK
jgi:hypothetical protein